MLRRPAARAVMGSFLLLGCSAQEPASLTQPGKHVFSVDMPLDKLASDPRANAVLDHDVPGVMYSTKYLMFEDMSLSQIASMSGGQLSQDKLDRVQRDLDNIPAGDAGTK
jgi:hypothetical protein